MDASVCNVTFLDRQGGQLNPFVNNVPEMQKRSSRNTKMQLKKSLNTSESVQLVQCITGLLSTASVTSPQFACTPMGGEGCLGPILQVPLAEHIVQLQRRPELTTQLRNWICKLYPIRAAPKGAKRDIKKTSKCTRPMIPS